MLEVTLSIILLLLLAVITLCVYSYRMKKRASMIGNGAKEDLESNVNVGLSQETKFPPELEIIGENIELEEIISTGLFAKLSKQYKVTVQLSSCDSSSKAHFRFLLSEIKILCYLGRHSNIANITGVYTKEIARGIACVLTEYCENGSLQNYLRGMQQKHDSEQNGSECSVDLAQLYKFSQEISSGMKYMAEKGVIHGDLSTRNILLTCQNTCKIRICGLLKRLYEYTECIKNGAEPLSWRWMAPETLKFMIFSTNSDVWSFGITLWEIFSLSATPYLGLTWNPSFVTELDNGLRLEKPQHASGRIYNKMLACLNIDAMERPSFANMETFLGQKIEHASRQV